MGSRAGVVLGGVAAVPAAIAGVAGASYVARAAAARRDGRQLEPGVPTPEPSFGLGGAVALDTLLDLPMGLLSSLGTPDQYAAAGAELDAAVAFHRAQGWTVDPSSRHLPPPPPAAEESRIVPPAGRRSRTEVLRFPSGWAPADGEPAGERWRSFAANGEVHVRLLRHGDGPRPWVVLVHGQGMGRQSDLGILRARRLHEQLGVDVALPVLPLHGPRSAGLGPQQQFVSNVFLLNNVLGLSQAVWDLRRLLAWLRREAAAPAVGVVGVSLGSIAAALLATVEPDLAAVVAVVPTSDLAASLRAADPSIPSRRRIHRTLHDERSTTVHRVVSPLAAPPVVPRERLGVVAGQVDRVASPAGAADLWRHWGEPSILWRPRGHLTTWRSAAYDEHVEGFLATSGLADRRGARCGN